MGDLHLHHHSRQTSQARHFIDAPEQAAAALFSIPPPLDRSTWISLGMASKRAGVTFDDFNRWSSQGENYGGENACHTDWKAFTENGEVSPNTLFKAARDAGWLPDKQHPMPPPAARPIRASLAFNEAPTLQENPHAREIWERCTPAETSHPYIIRKQGCADGLRVYPGDAPHLHIRGQSVAGWLVVPCIANDHLLTLQFIPPQADAGPKLNLAGASFESGYFAVGAIADAHTIYIGEGIGQAWACARASGEAAVCTFGAGRTNAVALALRCKYPTAKLVLVPDRGKEEAAAKIAASLTCDWIAMPQDMHANYDANDFAQDFGEAALKNHLAAAKAPPQRYKIISADELAEARPLNWMVRGVLPRTGLAALYGASGAGKSFLTLDLAVTIAGGANDWYGMRVAHCPVTYCVLEGEAGMGKRVKAWKQHYAKPLPALLRFVTQPVNLLNADDVADLQTAIMQAGGANGLVILDTLNRAAPEADENTSRDMGAIISAAKQLQQETGGLVLLVHHTGKDTAKGMRGHSSLFAALDGAIGVVSGGGNPSWTIAKSKDDATGAIHDFRLEQVILGQDDEGEDITSCVAVPVAAPFALRKSKRLPKHQQTAWDVLQALLSSTGNGIEGVRINDAVLAVENAIDADPKHKRLRAKDAIQALRKKAFIDMTETHIQLPERSTTD